MAREFCFELFAHRCCRHLWAESSSIVCHNGGGHTTDNHKNATSIFTAQVMLVMAMASLSVAEALCLVGKCYQRKSLGGRNQCCCFTTVTVNGTVRSGGLILCKFHADYWHVKHIRCVKASTANWQFAGFARRNAETAERMLLNFPNPPHQVTTPFTPRGEMPPLLVSLLPKPGTDL